MMNERWARRKCGFAHLRSRFHRPGFVAAPELYASIRALDIVVVPSRTEAFAHVLVEAMACSRPVVATGIEGNLDAFVDGHSGLYTEPDALSMAGRILTLLDDPARAAAMGAAASRRAELFDLDVTLPALGDAVQQVVDAKSKEAS